MPIKTTHTQATAARDRIRQALANLRQIRTTLATSIEAARRQAHADRDLSDEGKQNRLTQLAAQAREAAQRQLDALTDAIADDVNTVRAYVAEHRPQPQPGVEAMMARQAAWRRTEAMLSAGRHPQSVIAATGDVETLLVMREELPTWMQTQTEAPRGMDGVGFTEPDPTYLVRLVDERLAELTTGDQQLALTLNRELAVATAEMAPMVEYTRMTVAGESQAGEMGLRLAIESRQAAQSA